MASLDSSHDPNSTPSSSSLAAFASASTPTTPNTLPLPGELVDAVLAYLEPRDLARVCQVCRALHVHAAADRFWQAFVQDHVPGVSVASTPLPRSLVASFRELYVAHEPRWFLPRFKIWISGHDMAGKVMLVRYDPRRACIEGYQLLAVSNHTTYHHWPPDANVVVHAFEPEVLLHLDRPVLKLDVATAPGVGPNAVDAVAAASPPQRPKITMHWPGVRRLLPSDVAAAGGGESDDSPPPRCPRIQPIQMDVSGAGGEGGGSSRDLHRQFVHARPLDAEAERHGSRYRESKDDGSSEPLPAPHRAPLLPFPHYTVWPPPTIPAPQRVGDPGLGFDLYPRGPVGEPLLRSQIADRAFHVRTQIHAGHGHGHGSTNNDSNSDSNGARTRTSRAAAVAFDTFESYATLDPHLYTPTADKPFRGIWVGDYSDHGCEFLLVHQPDEDDDGETEKPFDEAEDVQPPRLDTEDDAAYERRVRDARIYRGRLEAIKLTGDPNVPRGEYTFVADDLGAGGFDTVMEEGPFAGVRIVKSLGHVAGTGFRNDRYVESRLILISPDRLAQYWVGFGHISFFERVDIDKFLDPYDE